MTDAAHPTPPAPLDGARLVELLEELAQNDAALTARNVADDRLVMSLLLPKELDMLRALAAALPGLLDRQRDAERLDAISQPGALTKVGMRAMANQADPPMRQFATVSIPLAGAHASSVSERRTLREAIDAATGCAEPNVRAARTPSEAPR